MATDKPPIVTLTVNTGGNTEGWSKGEITGLCMAVIAALTLILGISTCVWKCWQAAKKKNPRPENGENQQSPNHLEKKTNTSEDADEPLINQSPESRNAGAPESKANISGRSPNQDEIPETSKKANGSAGGDQSSLSDQADSTGLSEGDVDRQSLAAENRVDDMATSNQTFYDIYLVSTSKHTPHFKKMTDMCKKNRWKFTTRFDGKLGVPVMQSAEEAVLTCSHVVVVITKDDCLMEEVEFNMTIEMAFDSIKNNKIIPIRCCDIKCLPLRLKQLRGSSIDDDDLEESMIKTINKELRKKREAQCHSVSGEPGVSDGADENDEAGDMGGADERDGANNRGVADGMGGANESSGAD